MKKERKWNFTAEEVQVKLESCEKRELRNPNAEEVQVFTTFLHIMQEAENNITVSITKSVNAALHSALSSALSSTLS